MNYDDLVKCIYNVIFTGVCKVSLQRKTNEEKPVPELLIYQSIIKNNCRLIYIKWIVFLKVKTAPTLFFQSIKNTKKDKLFWSNLKSDSSSNMENDSKNKSTWSNLKSDTSNNIKNVSNAKFAWSTPNSYP